MSAAIGQQPAAERLAEALRGLVEKVSPVLYRTQRARKPDKYIYHEWDGGGEPMYARSDLVAAIESTLASITTQENDDEPTLD